MEKTSTLQDASKERPAEFIKDESPVIDADTEPTTIEKLRGLRWSIAANASNTVYSQFTFFGSVFILFLSALGLSKSQMGFILSLIPFTGIIAIFVAPAVARFGYKRTYLTFLSARKVATAFLLLTPWIAQASDQRTTLWFVAGVVAIFAIVRAIAFTGYYPWMREFVPDSVRGKYTAMNNIFTAVTGFVAVSVASYVLGRTTGLFGYMLLIAVGVLFGFIAVWCSAFIPGGAPVKDPEIQKRNWGRLLQTVHDNNFLRYLIGLALITLATIPLGSFLPLFMQEEVGLSSSNVVLLQTGRLLGGLLWSYIWGWAADRYGSKPVTLSGIGLSLVLPFLWVFMPRHAGPTSLYIALGIAFLQGIADLGWAIGSARLLYVGVVPRERNADYMTLYYAWAGVAGGVSRLLGGQILDLSQGLSGQFLIFPLDPYFPLFVAGFVLPLLSIFVFRDIQTGDEVGVGEFVGIFFRGNPFAAASSMIRFHMAKDERAAVQMTERLARSRSLLTVEELLEALEDPRFNVRFEAVIAISHMPPDRRLTRALVELLKGTELALTVVAAWALGRIGDRSAIGPLREGLRSEYRSIRAHCARALGALGDTESIPTLLELLNHETDRGLQMAYASALGNLRAREAAPRLLTLLREFQNRGARMELALSLARLVGKEHPFIQLVRGARTDAGTTIAQALTTLNKKILNTSLDHDNIVSTMDRCIQASAHGDLTTGAAYLSQIIRWIPPSTLDECARTILDECAHAIDEFGAERIEYILLALHILEVGWDPK